jgi:hypothetical protein
MTTLETNIVEQARQHLLELRGALLLPKGQGRSEGISSAFWMLNGLVLLANNTSNG